MQNWRPASKSKEKRTWRWNVTWLKLDTNVKKRSQQKAIFSTAKISGLSSKKRACAFSMYNTQSVHKAPALVGVIFVSFLGKIQVVRIVLSKGLFKLHRGDRQWSSDHGSNLVTRVSKTFRRNTFSLRDIINLFEQS
jgi:hypothetical protein